MKYQIIKMLLPDDSKCRFESWKEIPHVLSVNETQLDTYTLKLTFLGGDPKDIAEMLHFQLPFIYNTIGNIEVILTHNGIDYTYRFDLEEYHNENP